MKKSSMNRYPLKGLNINKFKEVKGMKKSTLRSLSATIVVLLLCVTLFSTLLPMKAFGAAWDGASMATGFERGDGSEESPYVIKTPDQLAYFALTVNIGEQYIDKYCVLASDIDLGGKPWKPIGSTYSISFQGNFDGRGHTISNMLINAESMSGVVRIGLFGALYEAELSNLNLKNAKLIQEKASTWTGLIAGSVVSSKITNCTVDADSSLTTTFAGSFGGLVGRITGKSTMQYCVNRATITSTAETGTSFVGGIAGVIGADETTVVSYSANLGEISCGTANTSYAGGIAGIIGAGKVALSEIRYSYNAALVSAKFGGGILGHMQDFEHHIVDNCVNSANVPDGGSILGLTKILVFITDCSSIAGMPAIQNAGDSGSSATGYVEVANKSALADRIAVIDNKIAENTVVPTEDTEPATTTGTPAITTPGGTTTALSTFDGLGIVILVSAIGLIGWGIVSRKKKTVI